MVIHILCSTSIWRNLKRKDNKKWKFCYCYFYFFSNFIWECTYYFILISIFLLISILLLFMIVLLCVVLQHTRVEEIFFIVFLFEENNFTMGRLTRWIRRWKISYLLSSLSLLSLLKLQFTIFLIYFHSLLTHYLYVLFWHFSH